MVLVHLPPLGPVETAVGEHFLLDTGTVCVAQLLSRHACYQSLECARSRMTPTIRGFQMRKHIAGWRRLTEDRLSKVWGPLLLGTWQSEWRPPPTQAFAAI